MTRQPDGPQSDLSFYDDNNNNNNNFRSHRLVVAVMDDGPLVADVLRRLILEVPLEDGRETVALQQRRLLDGRRHVGGKVVEVEQQRDAVACRTAR